MPYSLTEGTNTRAPNEVERCANKAEVVVRIHIRQACPTRPVGRFTDLPTHGLLPREGGKMVIVKTIVSTFTVMMMLLILFFAKGKDKATVVGFTFMEMLYAALLFFVWRG